MPLDLAPQFGSIRRMLDAMGLAVLEVPTYEADDILATIAQRTDELGGECFLVSGDKDCRQLITPRVKIFNVRKNQLYDDAALEADWGIRPEQVVDFQTLVGDSVDNIAGVPLVGPKVARQWLETVRHARRPAVARWRIAGRQAPAESARRRTEAVRNSAAGRAGAARADDDRLASRSRRPWWRCRSTGRAVRRVWISRPGRKAGPPRRAGDGRFSHGRLHRPADPPAAGDLATQPAGRRGRSNGSKTIKRSTRPKSWPTLSSCLQKQPVFAFDTETTHVWPCWAEMVGCSFCWQDGEAYYFPSGHRPASLIWIPRQPWPLCARCWRIPRSKR